MKIGEVLIIWNIIVFLIYGLDKLKAKAKAWRVPERLLLFLAFLMGSAGALAAMLIFRHKTKHRLFTIGVPLCLALNLLAFKFILALPNVSLF